MLAKPGQIPASPLQAVSPPAKPVLSPTGT